MNQIRSKERVRDLAEVFTNQREIVNMLDMMKDISYEVESTFLEPACGNGNFLVEILKRKTQTVIRYSYNKEEIEFGLLKAVSSVYGIDICKENVVECRKRIHEQIIMCLLGSNESKHNTVKFNKILSEILKRNIICANSLDKKSSIKIVSYSFPIPLHIATQTYEFFDCFKEDGALPLDAIPIKKTKPKPYLELFS